jgi:hypothetical protein
MAIADDPNLPAADVRHMGWAAKADLSLNAIELSVSRSTTSRRRTT